MRQRQPDRPHLLPAWRETVDDPSRDYKVRARIVVAQRQTRLRVVERGGGSGEDGGEAENERDALLLARGAGGAAVADAGARGDQDAS